MSCVANVSFLTIMVPSQFPWFLLVPVVSVEFSMVPKVPVFPVVPWVPLVSLAPMVPWVPMVLQFHRLQNCAEQCYYRKGIEIISSKEGYMHEERAKNNCPHHEHSTIATVHG